MNNMVITFKLPENAKKCAANITKNSDVLKSAAIILSIQMSYNVS
ncbi:MAG: hypothetical protein AB8V06_08280 [Francisella endosymbiont of Hyalomma asiaticum]